MPEDKTVTPEDKNDRTPSSGISTERMRSHLGNVHREVAALHRIVRRMEIVEKDLTAELEKTHASQLEIQPVHRTRADGRKGIVKHFAKSLILAIPAATLILGAFYLLADADLSPSQQDLTVVGVIIAVILGVGFVADSFKSLME